MFPLVLLGCCLIASSDCNPHTRHQALTLFFDNVPEPGADPQPRKPRRKKRVLPDKKLEVAALEEELPPLAPPVPEGPSIETVRTWEDAYEKLPKDMTGWPDWMAALREGVIEPRHSLDPEAERLQPFPLDVELDPGIPGFKVVFSHAAHTELLTCTNCHPGIFQMIKGSSPITMGKILGGEYCGRCHGKDAFPPEGRCMRCHTGLLPPKPRPTAVESVRPTRKVLAECAEPLQQRTASALSVRMRQLLNADSGCKPSGRAALRANGSGAHAPKMARADAGAALSLVGASGLGNGTVADDLYRTALAGLTTALRRPRVDGIAEERASDAVYPSVAQSSGGTVAQRAEKKGAERQELRGGSKEAPTPPEDLIFFQRRTERRTEMMDVPPAVFPHWFHRIRFRCYVCHTEIFPMRLTSEGITMDAMREGKFCGACHNGDIAWAPSFETCSRCHHQEQGR